MRYHISKHHAARLELRGISQEDVKSVIQYGEKQPAPGIPRHSGRIYKIRKTVGLNTLIVIVEIKREECWLITTYEN